MDKRKVTTKVIAFILAAFLINSCIKDEIDHNNLSSRIYWNPKIGIPIAYGNLSFEDIIESLGTSKPHIQSDSSLFMSLVYSSTIESGNADSLIPIANQHFNEVLLASQFNLPAFPTEDTILLNRTKNYSFSFTKGEIIDSMIIKTGSMVFNISSSYKYSGTLTIIVPKLIKNNKPLTITVDINNSNGTFNSIQTYDISGYRLQLDHPNINDNLMNCNFTAKLVNSGGGVSVGDNMAIDFNLNNIKFSSLFGYIGQIQLIHSQSKFKLPLFENISKTNLTFANPSLKIKTLTSFGIPTRIEIYNAKAVNEQEGLTVPININTSVNPFNISYPSILGQTKKDSAVFTNYNTNLNEALFIGPNNVFYTLLCSANPAGKALNYITDTSKMSIDVEMDLPLNMHISQVEFTDTIDLDLSMIDKENINIKSLLLHSSFENGMPLDLSIQVYLLDENSNHVDTLFSGINTPVIQSGTLDAQGKISNSTKKDIDILFTDEEIEKLLKVKKANIRAGITTANNGNTFIKFYSNYSLKVLFGIQTELENK